MEIIDIILPVFLVIALGYALRVIGFVSETINGALSKLVFYVAAPALLFHSTAGTPLALSVNASALLLIAGITLGLGLLVYVLTARTSPSRHGVLAQGGHRSNMVFVGLPIVANAYGDSALGPVSVLIGAMVVWYNLLAVLFLTLPHQQASARTPRVWLDTARRITRNPLIISCCGGILFSLLEIRLPVSLDRTLALVGRTALPLALISVGAGLEFGKLRAEMPATILIAIVKLLIYPGCVYLGLLALGYRGTDLEIPVLIMATPTAVVSYIMAQEMNGDERLASAIVIGTTAASLLTISGWLVLFRYL